MSHSVDQTAVLSLRGRRLYLQAAQYFQQGSWRAVIDCCQRLQVQHEDFAEGWYMLSCAAESLGEITMALEASRRAVQTNDKQADYHIQLARCLVTDDANSHREALQVADRAGQLKPQSAVANDTLGCIYSRVREHQKAISFYQKAVTLAPKVAIYRYNLSAALRFIGDFDAAEKHINEAIALEPDDYQAYLNRAQLRTQTASANHIEQLQNRLTQGVSSLLGEVHLCYALAKEYEDIGHFDEAFHYLERGAQKMRCQFDYQVEIDEETMVAMAESFGEKVLTGTPHSYGNSEPIFIVGMPRTGTTLVERILGSHDDVYAAGELRNFAILLNRFTGNVGAQNDSHRLVNRQLIEKGLAVDMEALGKAYIESTRPRTGHTRHFLDKLPLNFMMCGFIHRALPQAKIIHVHRNPMDTCFSNYKQLFHTGYFYSFVQEELGRYYAAYSQLMEHWHRVMPGKILDIRYENLVEDLERGSRHMLDFCELDWQPACLEFHKNPEASDTASATQVRSPIYKSSVNRWHHFANHLLPLKQELQRAGIVIS